MKGKSRIRLILCVTFVALVIYYFCLPNVIFADPYSTVLEDQKGELLSASIANDGQWRFPEVYTVPEKFAQALITFEDKRFKNHLGVDLRSLGRAMKQNIQAGEVKSGGSTITMQVIRLSRKGKSRSLFQKAIEIIFATRLEFRYSKDEIIGLYASHAPFGGNVVGLEAACWRYFGRDPQELSWGEAALLAVLPNAPSLIHPGKNRFRLKSKRDKLLDRLFETKAIDAFTCSLAKDEPIPDAPQGLPRYARHLLARASNEGFAQMKIHSTIQAQLQLRVEQILHDHHQRLKANQVFNGAAIVVEVSTGNVIAYVGNTEVQERGHYGDAVDVITSPRSTGSILKPFLFAAMLEEGKMLSRTLQPDIPTMINGFAPQNFSLSYDGAAPASKALIRSLNIPAVYELRNYRYEKFHSLLKNIGMSTLDKPADHYGLSLILGGAEGTLWDITGMYASMARTLNNFFEHPGKNKYDRSDFHSLHYLSQDSSYVKLSIESSTLEENSILSAASIYQTFDVLKEVYRPGEETGWRYFSNSKKIAWKTGTSFGFRDAWAVGVTPGYVVGVWVGNADGEGRPGLTGTEASSPVMFDIFSQLPNTGWFQQPKIEMEQITICSQSGHRNTILCDKIDTVWVTKAGLQTPPCPYHKRIHLSSDKKFRVHSECESFDQMVDINWFVLPPVQEYYFRQKNASYKALPSFRSDCQPASPLASMDLIYPKPNVKIFIPRELDGKLGSAVFELAHRNPSTKVYWHLDGHYIGSTQKSHRLPLKPTLGKHILTLVDENGESMEQVFDVL